MTDLDELERLLREATRGPWSAEPVINHPPPIDDGWELLSHSRSEVIANAESDYAGDLLLVAALRNSAEELIRDARRLQYILDRVVEWEESEGVNSYLIELGIIKGASTRAALDAVITKDAR